MGMRARGPITVSYECYPLSLRPISLWRFLPRREWGAIRRVELKRARYRCEICGGLNRLGGAETRLICHEQWRFDARRRILTLQELQIICFDCNTLYHPGTGGGLWIYKQGGRVLGAKAIGRLLRPRRLPWPSVRLLEDAWRAQRKRKAEPWQLKIAPALRARHPVLRNELEFEAQKALARGKALARAAQVREGGLGSGLNM